MFVLLLLLLLIFWVSYEVRIRSPGRIEDSVICQQIPAYNCKQNPQLYRCRLRSQNSCEFLQGIHFALKPVTLVHVLCSVNMSHYRLLTLRTDTTRFVDSIGTLIDKIRWAEADERSFCVHTFGVFVAVS